MNEQTELLLGTMWETFHIAERKVGFLHRKTTTSEDVVGVLVSRLHIVSSVTGDAADFAVVVSRAGSRAGRSQHNARRPLHYARPSHLLACRAPRAPLVLEHVHNRCYARHRATRSG